MKITWALVTFDIEKDLPAVDVVWFSCVSRHVSDWATSK